MSPSPLRARVRLHLRRGWLSIAVFVVLGAVLEVLHALKAPVYLDVGSETRRLMWTLAHAHGTLFGLLHVAFAATMASLGEPLPRQAGRALTAAGVLLPLGFFLGGLWTWGGDPGLGVVLAPVGALAAIFAVVRTALAIAPPEDPDQREHPRV